MSDQKTIQDCTVIEETNKDSPKIIVSPFVSVVAFVPVPAMALIVAF